MAKIKFLDLFCGCGGLSYGFIENKNFILKLSADNDESSIQSYKSHIKQKGLNENLALNLDLTNKKDLVNFKNLKSDLIIGGPPCQAYSIAGRIRDKDGMKNDYRNYLFESFLKIISSTKSKYFIMENVPGILSAKPGGILITDRIKEKVKKIDFYIPDNLKNCLYNVDEYGVAQKRKRIIIFGISKKINKYKEISRKFYESLDSLKTKNKITVEQAIGDLAKLKPLSAAKQILGKKYSHGPISENNGDHVPRFHNKRDIEIFKILAQDIENKKYEFTKIENLKKLYKKMVNKSSSVHKYYVLRKNEQSNLIPAHLYKDGLRHIHYDSSQARTITVREAARLQSFPDSFKFSNSLTNSYKMIGNAVPPLFSTFICKAFLMSVKR